MKPNNNKVRGRHGAIREVDSITSCATNHTAAISSLIGFAVAGVWYDYPSLYERFGEFSVASIPPLLPANSSFLSWQAQRAHGT
jgi:hypothetical protein